MAQIEIKNVTKIIKHNTVIDHISLTMKSGEITGLKGVNGSDYISAQHRNID